MMWSTKFSQILLLSLLASASHVTDDVLAASNTTDDVLARALCQCSVDGTSAGVDVFYWDHFGTTYDSENIQDGGPYRFIGCGAHKFYRDRSERQIGGYPWRICYTYGGNGGCTMTKTSRKHALNYQIAHRLCSGDYDCGASSDRQVQGGKFIGAQVLRLTDDEGMLNDWTNCCQICGQTNECTAWDFSIETMNCQLFSAFEGLRVNSTSNTAPLWYAGTPGFDDKPVECWFRNQYDTCTENYEIIFVVSIVLCGIGTFFLLLWCTCCAKRGKVLCWTDDVTPGYTTPIVRQRSSKGGGSTSYTVMSYSAHLVYKLVGQVHRDTVCMENKEIKSNVKFYFLANPTGEGFLIPLGHSLSICNSGIFCFIAFLLPALMCLFVLSLQIVATDGGLFQAKYTLPDSGGRSAWIAYFSLTCFAPFAAIVCLFARVTRGKHCKPGNTYTRAS
mmetsp:Transcript_19263/g.24832  ORF Transcript_19263/g.24832 Transcript_19263/m.24832 type:complete len:446 (-) Transcript_19263:26-1363(-)